MPNHEATQQELARVFEAERPQLRALARGVLGRDADAEDAVQEAWLRLSRLDDPDRIENLAGWLRTVVTRVCLDSLRAARTRRETPRVPQDLAELDELVASGRGARPDEDAVLADGASRALLVVLGTLAPAERVAVVLHDVFGMPFDEIAALLERSPDAAKQLASRGRRRVRGEPRVPPAELVRQRRTVGRFLDAARDGDLSGVLAVLAPDAVRHADPTVLPAGAPSELRGAPAVARGTLLFGRRAALADLVLIDGTVGAVVALDGRVALALTFTVADDRITRYDVLADPAAIAELELAMIDSGTVADSS